MLTTPTEALRTVLAAVQYVGAHATNVAFSGSEPALPSRFLLASAGAATIAAVGVAVADLWRLRGGAEQDISIDLAHAAAALRSNVYLRINGQAPPSPWDPIAGFYPTRDGRHIQLHTNFPHHRDGTLALLGIAPRAGALGDAGDDRAAVAAVIAQRDAFVLEQQMAQAGLCAAVARTGAEWRAHPQRQAIDALPLLEILKIADSPPQPLPLPMPIPAARPLSGVRVLDLTRVLAGPTAGRTLAEHGAEVLAIASPLLPNLPMLVLDTNHGKYSAHLHLEDPDERARLQQLVRGADVFVQGYRPGALATKGFSTDDLVRLRPGIIVMDLSAYGHLGPWALRRGYDTLVQSASGIALEQGGGGAPKHLPCSALDYITGYLGAFGVVTALARRALHGGSYLVRVSLAQTARWLDELGRIGGDAPAAELAPDVSALLMEQQSPAGLLRFLGPVLHLSQTPPGWDFAAVPLGTHAPQWR